MRRVGFVPDLLVKVRNVWPVTAEGSCDFHLKNVEMIHLMIIIHCRIVYLVFLPELIVPTPLFFSDDEPLDLSLSKYHVWTCTAAVAPDSRLRMLIFRSYPSPTEREVVETETSHPSSKFSKSSE